MLKRPKLFAVLLLIGFAISTASAFENANGSIIVSNSSDAAGQIPPPPPTAN